MIHYKSLHVKVKQQLHPHWLIGIAPPRVHPAIITIVHVDTKCVCDESRRATGVGFVMKQQITARGCAGRIKGYLY